VVYPWFLLPLRCNRYTLDRICEDTKIVHKLHSESTQLWRINFYLPKKWLWHMQELKSTTYLSITTSITRAQVWPWKNVSVRFCGYFLSCADMLVALAVYKDRNGCTPNWRERVGLQHTRVHIHMRHSTPPSQCDR